MVYCRDPEEVERRYLHEFVDVRGARILEVGSGDGYLTWRFAATAQTVIGTDANADWLAETVRDQPARLQNRVKFTQSQAEALPFPSQSFDLVIFSSSL